MGIQDGMIAVAEGLPYVLGGVGVTLTVVGGALAMGLALGLLLALAQVYGPAWVRRPTASR